MVCFFVCSCYEPVLFVFICRFDSELSAAQDEVQREKTFREKLAREKDMLTGEVFSLKQQVEVLYLHLLHLHIFFIACLYWVNLNHRELYQNC